MLLQQAKSTFTPSKYQAPILEHVQKNLEEIKPYVKTDRITTGILDVNVPNIQVKASAGSGKTTLLAEAFRLHYQMSYPINSIQVLSFVKQNVEDIKKKFKDIVEPQERDAVEKQINTFNSFGYGSLMRAYEKWNQIYPANQCNLQWVHQDKKYHRIAERFIYERKYNPNLCSLTSLVSFVDKLREQVILRPAVQDLRELATNYNIRQSINNDHEWNSTLELIKAILYEGIKKANPFYTPEPIADFIDQCLIPFALAQGSSKNDLFTHFKQSLEDWKVKNTLLLVDEVQDINPILLKMVEYMASPWSTVIIVGDSGQNIYKWRGSRANGMDELASSIGAISYSLPISYRMPKNHIEMIKEIHPERHIEHHHEKDGRVVIINKQATKDGEPTYIEELKPYLESKLSKLILSRKRSNIVLLALDLLKHGYIVNVKGMATTAKTYAKQVCGYYKKGDKIKYPTKNPGSMIDWIEAWRDRKVRVLEGRNSPKSEINEINDWAVCLLTLFFGLEDKHKEDLPKTWEEYEERINVLSTRKKKGVISISTIHSAKGAEAPIVIFVDPSECPITWSRQSKEDLEQEQNALFVAISRTKLTDDPMSGTLVLLTDGPIKNQLGWLRVAGNYADLDF